MRMAQRTKQRLDEVKLTLQRLQRIALDPSNEEIQAAKIETAPPRIGPAVEAARLAGLKALPAGRSAKRYGAFAAALAALVVVAGFATWMLRRPGPMPQPTAATAVDMPVRPLPAPSVVTAGIPAVTEAQELLDAGKISGARLILGEIAPNSSEAALMLARSYDPNFVRHVAQPDAEPDPIQAERWYRAWHDIAAKNGLVMEPDRLERIIKAMK
jgi:hypothetical protein